MSSSSRGQSDAPAAMQSPQLQQPPAQVTDAVVPDAHPGRGETVPEPLDLPDVCKPEWQRDGMPDTEFYRKYPPDPWGEELSPNARVWKIYRDQQDLSHNSVLEGWNKTLDVLLIFAGLFSAVLTAFLIESYKSLQPDYTQYVAAFLYAAAVSHNGTGGIFPALDMIVAPDRFIQTSVAQRWTNGLWFSSLVISLAVALLCILIKQWLDAYDSHISAASPSPRHWARRHKLYHRGLKKWGLPGLISFLPLLLHVALFLFFVGLILFLRPLDGAIAYSLLVMVSCIAAFYVLSLILPAWRVDCPSYTPLLPHALAVVSRAVSTLLYLFGPIESPGYVRSMLLGSTLWYRMTDAYKWLTSIKLQARDQFLHETRSLDKGAEELDGFVLSTLIQLPVDADQDIVNTACLALAALNSPVSIEAISGEVSSDILGNQLDHCRNSITFKATAFITISLEQLWRAHETMSIPNNSQWTLIRTHLHRPCFGIRSLLLRALGLRHASGRLNRIDPLIQQLQALSSLEDSSQRLPPRSACLIYLEFYALCPGQHRSGFSCFLLFFCAGRFASADTHELVRALRSVRLVLETEQPIGLPAHDAGDRDYIMGIANSLWLMLSESPEYSIDTVTAQIVASHTLACFNRFSNRVVWAEFSGLSAFVRSPTFANVVETRDIRNTALAGNLGGHMMLFRYSLILDLAKVRLEDYWACISTLLKFRWDSPLASERAASFIGAYALFPVEPFQWKFSHRLSEGGPYATQDDWYEPALAAFLDGPNAITTWNRSWYNADELIRELGHLANRISIVLCRRQRLGRPNDSFVSAFFSGPFLLACFRDRVTLQSPVLRQEFWAPQNQLTYEEAVEDLAKHCLKLSPERFMAMLTQLEETGDAGSELRARAVAFSQRIRVLSTECNADCACTLPGARAVSSARARWNALAARFRRGRADPATASNV